MKTLCILVLLLAWNAFAAFAQPPARAAIPVTGKVMSSGGQPIAGASVVEKGTSKGTTTDEKGEFRLAVADSSAVLVISSVNYVTSEVKVGSQSALTITLTESAGNLNDVVVVGYGTKRRGDVTGAISTVSSEKVKAVPVTNVTQALQGRVAGVDANMSSFRPGSGATIRIRATVLWELQMNRCT